VSEHVAPVLGIEDFEFVKQRNLWLDALERLIRNRTAMFGLFICVVIIFIAIFGSFLAPKDYLRTNISNIAAGPSLENFAGTDLVGRDVFSRLLHGARTAVFAATITVVLGNIIGITAGALAGYLRGIVDDVIMRITDILFSFPDFLFAAFLSASLRTPVVKLLGQLQQKTGWEFLDQTIFLDYIILFGALAMVNWSGVARLVRGQILSLREQDFVRAEIALGMPTYLVIRKHLIPNSIAPVVVGISGGIGSVLLLESSLSFLGLGIQPPAASWGDMINTALPLWRVHPWLVLIPGGTLAIAVFGFNYLGDGINDALNPRQIQR